MAQPKVYIDPKHKIKSQGKIVDPVSLRQQFVDEVQSLKIQSRRLKNKLMNNKHLVIFIHGFRNNETQMHDRSAYLDQQLGTDKVITTAFNWESCCPSLGISSMLYGYLKDQAFAKKIGEYFAFYLEEIRKPDIHQFEQVDIVAHSMGNHILVHSITHCAANKTLDVFEDSNIIAVAPDAEKEHYILAAECLTDEDEPIASKWIHFWNRWDGALIASKYVNVSNRAGAGHVNVSSPHFQSWQWEKKWPFDHGYIGNILDDDGKFKNKILKWLKLNDPQMSQVIDDDHKAEHQREVCYAHHVMFHFCSMQLIWYTVYIDGKYQKIQQYME